jgi:FMN phosphatase YigB (HAD superfamily)
LNRASAAATLPRMPTVDAVLLDLGNVLAFHDNALLCRRLAVRAGVSPEGLEAALSGPLAERINRGEVDGDGIRREVGRVLGRDLPAEGFAELFSSHFTLHEEVLPRVEALCARLPVVLLSNTNAIHWDFLRRRLPVLERFAGHCLSHVEGRVKPDPAFYLHAVQMASAVPSRCAFFDDIPAYVDAACALGLQGFVFTDAAAFEAQLGQLGL